MRIAVCIFGKVGGMSRDGLYADLDIKKLHDNFRENILHGNHHYDVFIHSWSKHKEYDIINLYNPTDYIIEKEKFSPPRHYKDQVKIFRETWDQYDQHDDRKIAIHKSHQELWAMEIFRSRWYSQSRSIKLMDSYSRKINVGYDAVLVIRFDCAWFTKFSFEQINPNAFYVLGGQFQPSLVEVGEVVDFWFASSQRNIAEFGKAWDWIERDECFDFKQGTLCKEHFNAMTSHKMSYYLIESRLQLPIEAKYVQHVDCGLARGHDSFWKHTNLSDIK